MAIGMSPEEFWHGEPNLAVAYREAFRRKMENQHLQQWRMGVYIAEAVASQAHLINPFAKKQMYEYPTMPHQLTDERTDETKDRMAVNVQAFEALAINHNASIQRKLDNEG